VTEDQQKTADEIIGVVEEAVTAAAPIVSTVVPEVAPEVVMVVAGLRALLSWAKQAGHGDVVREALDAELATGRQATDAALTAKHNPQP
jgi:hypothetical protein